MVTGIATAMLDSSPVICITGQVSSKVLGTDAFQEVDITGVTLPVTKHNYLVSRAEDIAPTLREAFQVAQSGRPGPVLVDITKDAQQGTALFDFAAAAPRPYKPHPMVHCDDAGLKAAAKLISQSKRAIVLAGRGVMQSNATQQLRAFAEQAQIPVSCTLLGLGGFPASHPLALGMMGMHGEAWVNQAVQDADLLIAVGMRFDDRVIGVPNTYAPNAKKIHMEIDPSEINKNIKVDVALLGDLKQTLQELLALLGKRDGAAWIKAINASKGDCAVRDINNLPDTGHLYAAHVMNDLWHATQGEAIVVTDVGQHQMWEAQYYKHDRPRSLITSGGLGTMGFALPAAIGAKIACPEKQVWVVAGDGGFQMTSPELATIQQEKLDLNIAIINNGYLGMVRQWQEFFYEKNYESTPLVSPDFVKLAQAYGISASAVTNRGQILPTVKAAQAEKAAYLIDFQVEQEDSVYPMIPQGAALHEMIRRPQAPPSNPLVETAEDR
jgi:acetolactate synthase-1/2/3 large subunit